MITNVRLHEYQYAFVYECTDTNSETVLVVGYELSLSSNCVCENWIFRIQNRKLPIETTVYTEIKDQSDKAFDLLFFDNNNNKYFIF